MKVLLPRTFHPLTISWEVMGSNNLRHEVIDAIWRYLKILNKHGWFSENAHDVNRMVIESSVELIARKKGGINVSVYGEGHEYRVYFRLHRDGIRHCRLFQF